MVSTEREPGSPVDGTARRQLLARMRDELTTLAATIDATQRDAHFTAALETMASFWRYSPFNQWLIRFYRPNATRVAGQRTWEQLSRKVKKGEEPIWIFAPSSPQRGFPFVGVPVFDIRQTRGRRLPRLELTLRGRTQHVGALEGAATKLGILVGVLPASSNAAGQSTGGEIFIRNGLSQRERAAVLAHELAHEVLHQAERVRATLAKRKAPVRSHAEREAEAEGTSYVVLRVLGLPSTAPTYIAWQRGNGAMILTAMNRIQRAARSILDAAGIDPLTGTRR